MGCWRGGCSLLTGGECGQQSGSSSTGACLIVVIGDGERRNNLREAGGSEHDAVMNNGTDSYQQDMPPQFSYLAQMLKVVRTSSNPREMHRFTRGPINADWHQDNTPVEIFTAHHTASPVVSPSSGIYAALLLLAS